MAINIGGWTIDDSGLATKTIGSDQAIISLNANGKFDVERIGKDSNFKSTFEDFATALYNCEQWLQRHNLDNY